MTGTPAATLLHLGPGLGNGLANLHNARKGRVPVVNIVGDHATYHGRYDVPLLRPLPRPDVVATAAAALRSGEPTMLLLGGTATGESGVVLTARIAQAHDARMLAETFPTRVTRGAGLPTVGRLPYLAEAAAEALAGLHHLILVDAKHPASFFAYPDLPSDLVPDGCEVHQLAGPGDDAVAALEALAVAVEAPESYPAQETARPGRPTGDLTAQSVSQAIGALLPEGAVVSDEANTSGFGLPSMTAGAPRHDWLTLTGGAIGQGLPVAVGAAVACPDHKVLALQADGSALYTIQSLWTMAREELDVVTVIFNNRSYAILNMELQRVGAEAAGPKALSQLDLSRPDLDFVQIAEGFGVPAERPTRADDLAEALEHALATPGPHLIEAVI